MKINKKIKDFFRAVTDNKSGNLDENLYYKKLFVENPTWNSTEPNEDEASRWQVIENMLKRLIDIKEIIDVGCGRGWLSNKLSAYGEVTGIEPVETVVEHAKKLFPKIKFYSLRPDEYIEQYKKSYSVVVCSEVLEHVIDKSKFIHDLNVLTSENGHLIVTTPRAELKKLWEDKYGAPAQPIEEWISTEDLKYLIAQNGFRIISSENAFSEDIYQIHLCKKI
jgi:2-polyprenyl-3-methyl-5-hydroxy-6-metoxy-1,4-benzoquinol methylase